MADDQTDVKQVAGEEASISEPSTEEPKASGEVEAPSSETERPEMVVEEVTEEEEPKTEEAPKKGAQSRIRELNAKAKEAEERAQSLEEKIAELTRGSSPQGPMAPQLPQIQPGQELTLEQYQQHVLQTANAMVDLRVKQSEAVQRINTETSEVMRKHPELDPDSDSFDRELSDAVTEAVEASVRANPYSASPKKVVEKMLKPYNRAVAKEVGKASENIAKQVSSAATRPTSVTTKGKKDYADMTPEELERELGVIQR